MKQYYLYNGQNQIGPFSIEELEERKITNETYVWKYGMSDWVHANEMDELKAILTNTPPPFNSNTKNILPARPIYNSPKNSDTYKAGNLIGRNWKKLSIALVIGVVLLIFYNNSKEHNSNTNIKNNLSIEKSPEELRMELQIKEKENPLEYLKSDFTRRKNLLGENVFEGTITNTASTASFKDITVKIRYLSKTRSVIGYHDFIVYEIIGPQQTISIKKVKYFAPNDTDEYNVDIVEAIAVD